MADLQAKEYKGFEEIKHRDEEGVEYWLARELAPALEYVQWRNFEKVIDRAILACRNSGFEIGDNFVKVSKMVEMPIKPRKSEKIGFADVSKTKIKDFTFFCICILSY